MYLVVELLLPHLPPYLWGGGGGGGEHSFVSLIFKSLNDTQERLERL